MIDILIKKINTKLDSIPTDGSISDTKMFAQAFGLGAALGAIDVLVVVGAIATVATTITIIKNNQTAK